MCCSLFIDKEQSCERSRRRVSRRLCYKDVHFFCTKPETQYIFSHIVFWEDLRSAHAPCSVRINVSQCVYHGKYVYHSICESCWSRCHARKAYDGMNPVLKKTVLLPDCKTVHWFWGMLWASVLSAEICHIRCLKKCYLSASRFAPLDRPRRCTPFFISAMYVLSCRQ